MSIRTLEHLSDALSDELAWRRKELSSVKFLVDAGHLSFSRRNAAIRAAVPLLYAHWEGFVKASSRYYLEFVHYQRLPYSGLARNFITLGARSTIQKGSAAHKVEVQQEITSFFLDRLSDEARLPHRTGLSTRSNLSSGVLREIVVTLGLDFGFYETKAHLIDQLLLERRNTIAHGEYLLPSREQYVDIHDQVVDMLELFRNQIENAAVQRHYSANPVGVA